MPRYRTEFLHLGTIDILGQIILSLGPSSTFWMFSSIPGLYPRDSRVPTPPYDNQERLHMLPDVLWEAKSPPGENHPCKTDSPIIVLQTRKPRS